MDGGVGEQWKWGIRRVTQIQPHPNGSAVFLPSLESYPTMVKQNEPITGPGSHHLDLEPVTSKTSDVIVEKSEVKDVHATYQEAIAAAPFQPWSKSSIQLYFIFLVAYVNAMASGFDGVRTWQRGVATS